MRILVIEDDQKIADFIAEALRQDQHFVETAIDGEAGARQAADDPAGFDVLVLDLMLPKLDGFGVLASLRSRGNGTPVLMLSARDSVDDRVRGLHAGADDYLIKPFAMDELTARLLALVRRRSGAAPDPSRLSLADLTLDRLSRRVRRGQADIELQPKEFALLEYLFCNVGRNVTRAMILENVWGWTFDPRTNVVDVLVLRLRNKIDRGTEQRLIHTVRNTGYVLRAG